MKKAELEYCLRLSPEESNAIATKHDENKVILTVCKEKGDRIEKPILAKIENLFHDDPDFSDAELVNNGDYGKGFDCLIRNRLTGESVSDEFKHIFSRFSRGNAIENYYHKRAYRVVQGKVINNIHETVTVFGNMDDALKKEFEFQGVTVMHHPETIAPEKELNEKQKLQNDRKFEEIAKSFLQNAKKKLKLKRPRALNTTFTAFRVLSDKVVSGKLIMNPTLINEDQFKPDDEQSKKKDIASVLLERYYIKDHISTKSASHNSISPLKCDKPHLDLRHIPRNPQLFLSLIYSIVFFLRTNMVRLLSIASPYSNLELFFSFIVAGYVF